MTFRASIVTLHPEMFPGPLQYSLAGRALENGVWTLNTANPRDDGIGKHRQVDDTPAGGGAGMVMRCDVMARALDRIAPADDRRPRLLMSPRGEPVRQETIHELAGGEGVVIVCGRFEGVDERLQQLRGLREVSVADCILSGGEPAALVILDAIVRVLPGVMGNSESARHESFSDGWLEYPQYTRPQSFEGLEIPAVLLSGDHGRIEEWRRQQAVDTTAQRRPDLIPRAAKKNR